MLDCRLARRILSQITIWIKRKHRRPETISFDVWRSEIRQDEIRRIQTTQNHHWTTSRPAHDHSGELAVIIRSRSIPFIFQLVFVGATFPHADQAVHVKTLSCSKGHIIHPSQTRARCTTPRLLPSLVSRLFSTLRMGLSHTSESPNHPGRDSFFKFISSSYLAFEFCPSRFFQESTQTFYDHDFVQPWRFQTQDDIPHLWRSLLDTFSPSTPARSLLPVTPCSLLLPIPLALCTSFIFIASKSSILENIRQLHLHISVCFGTFLQSFCLCVAEMKNKSIEIHIFQIILSYERCNDSKIEWKNIWYKDIKNKILQKSYERVLFHYLKKP